MLVEGDRDSIEKKKRAANENQVLGEENHYDSLFWMNFTPLLLTQRYLTQANKGSELYLSPPIERCSFPWTLFLCPT